MYMDELELEGNNSDGHEDDLLDVNCDEIEGIIDDEIINSPLMRGVTTDGASVMTGKKSGVQARFKKLCNMNMLGSHCIAHIFQLALKDVMEKSRIC